MAVMVEITRSEVLRPPPETARGGGRKDPLTVFDRASTDVYIRAVFAWNAPAPANDKIKDGLLAAVARFPRLAGRFPADDRGGKGFLLNDAGVLVLEATAAADLADALAHDVSAHINDLYPKADKEAPGGCRFWVWEDEMGTRTDSVRNDRVVVAGCNPVELRHRFDRLEWKINLLLCVIFFLVFIVILKL